MGIKNAKEWVNKILNNPPHDYFLLQGKVTFYDLRTLIENLSKPDEEDEKEISELINVIEKPENNCLLSDRERIKNCQKLRELLGLGGKNEDKKSD